LGTGDGILRLGVGDLDQSCNRIISGASSDGVFSYVEDNISDEDRNAINAANIELESQNRS
jgi:hypothetical protein